MKKLLVLSTALVLPWTSPSAPASAAVAELVPLERYAVSQDDVDRIEGLVSATVDPRLRRRGGISLAEKAELVAPCVELSLGDAFCLGLGYRDAMPRYRELLQSPSGHATGALSFHAWVQQRWSLSNRARLAAQAEEVGDVEASLDKARAVRAFLDSLDTETPLSTMDSLAAQQAEQDGPALRRDPPEGDFAYIMGGHATKQAESHWCGVATFQMIEWADDETRQTQAHWADELGTTDDGTAITSIVSLINSRTAWDNAAGNYVVKGVSGWSADRFFAVHKAHLGDTTPAPIVEHPLLETRFFTYLREDGNGHFQVGRGFSAPADPDQERSIGIFEPWNETDWYGNGNVTWGAHNVAPAKLLNATKANSDFKNIGL